MIGMQNMIKRKKLRIRGIVQGVGFRPFIYRLAQKHDLSGFVLNDDDGVFIEVQGREIALKNFGEDIIQEAPPAAAISTIKAEWISTVASSRDFKILPSPQAVEREAMISPDLAICDDCRREILDKNNRRYHYAFTNCTNCGPRFSIVQDVPYDRKNTTMCRFTMCDKCQYEYDEPLNRRFHAQPNACSECGPAYSLFEASGKKVIEHGAKAVAKAHELIKSGAIIAVKGIGGYHLACDATNSVAVATLRNRKIREDKPFAVMTANLNTVKKLCLVNDNEVKLLTSAAAPIVLLAKNEVSYNLAEQVAPDNAYLGVMIAYAPVHCLLLHDDDVFVMTSANLSDEPIVYRDEEAVDRLPTIADYILSHNRLINTRVDDSVVRIFRGSPLLFRRSRGFVPSPILLKNKADISVLSCGAELKNTFCLTKHDRAFISQHIGDLENMAVNNSYKESIALFEHLFDIKPTLAACDFHPDYFSTRYAKSLHKDLNLPLTQVQHHHAHIASVLAEHDLQERVIGVALDGTGFGEDGNIWGGEFIVADLASYRRMGRFAYMPLPGGARAVKEPWRLALYQAYKVHGKSMEQKYPELLYPNWKLLLKAAENGLNAPLTSSAGRVFDTVAALLGIRHRINYEGQAAIELERLAQNFTKMTYGKILPYEIKFINGKYILDFTPLYRIIYDLKQSYSIDFIAKSFHFTLAKAIGDMVRYIGKDTGIRKVALSGGVCQNFTLLELVYRELANDYTLYINNKVPPNDGGISFGQAAVALKRYELGLI